MVCGEGQSVRDVTRILHMGPSGSLPLYMMMLGSIVGFSCIMFFHDFILHMGPGGSVPLSMTLVAGLSCRFIFHEPSER